MEAKVLSREKDIVKLEIPVKKEDAEKAKDLAFRKYRNRFPVRGFRANKAPRRIVENYYGKDAFNDFAAQEVLNNSKDFKEDYLFEAIVSTRTPITDLTPDWGTVDNGDGTFNIVFDVHVLPEPTLLDESGIDIEEPDVEVSDKEVEMELVRQAEENLDMVDVEGPIEDGMVVEFSVAPYQIGEEATRVLAGIEGMKAVIGGDAALEGGLPKEVLESLEGAKAGDVVHVELEGEEGVKRHYSARIESVREPANKKIDDDFARYMSIFDTLEEYKGFLRKTLLKDKAKRGLMESDDKALTALINGSEMDFPMPYIVKQRDLLKAEGPKVTEEILKLMRLNPEDEGLSAEEQYIKFRENLEIIRNMFDQDLLGPASPIKDLAEQTRGYFEILFLEALGTPESVVENIENRLYILLNYYQTLMYAYKTLYTNKLRDSYDFDKLKPYLDVLADETGDNPDEDIA